MIVFPLLAVVILVVIDVLGKTKCKVAGIFNDGIVSVNVDEFLRIRNNAVEAFFDNFSNGEGIRLEEWDFYFQGGIIEAITFYLGNRDRGLVFYGKAILDSTVAEQRGAKRKIPR